MSKWRKIFFSLGIFCALFILSEAGLRIIYFQAKAQSPLALVTAIRVAKTWYQKRIAIREIRRENIPAGASDSLWTDRGSRLLEHFSKVYEQNFARLVDEVKAVDSKLIVVLIPRPELKGMRYCQEFFGEITGKYEVPLCDLTDDFMQYPVEAVTLLPQDGHMSKFGHMLVADKLGTYVRKYHDHHSRHTFDSRPSLFGDLTPNHNQFWEYKPIFPYRVVTNSQGLRNTAEVSFPKKKQRVLVLGDSQSFGAYVNNELTYTELLNQKFPDTEFFNAAKAGYTITDELSLFVERARYLEPDITVLQVGVYDLFGLFYFKPNEFDRKGIKHEPSELEREYLDGLRGKN